MNVICILIDAVGIAMAIFKAFSIHLLVGTEENYEKAL
jgi:hypothetical protein